MSDTLDMLVIGAGISGLAFAHRRLAAHPGERLLVLEAAPRVGGLVRTLELDGFRFEEGPEAVAGGARSTRELCAELGLAAQQAPSAAGKRFLLLDGKLQEVPASPEDLATSRVLSFGAKLRLMGEPACAAGTALDGSIADFARHRLGKEALERLVDPLVAGIHAGDAEELSLRACFPEVARMVEEHGSLMAAMKARAAARKPGVKGAALGGELCRPAGGMEALPRALGAALGAHLRTSTPVAALTRAGDVFRVEVRSGASHSAARVVLALPLAAARTLLAEAAPEAAAALADMRAENLVSVVHGYRRADVAHALDGFGYLVPKSAGGLVLGTLFSSSLDPACAPAGHVLLRSLVGGARHPQAGELADAELCEHVHRECAGPLGLARAPTFTHVARYAGVIPRYDLGHLERRARLERGLPPRLSVLGNFTHALGLESLIASARALALES